MKLKVSILAVLMVLVSLVPVAGVFADTQFWSGQASITVAQSMPSFIVSTASGGGGTVLPSGQTFTQTYSVGTMKSGTLYVYDADAVGSAHYTITPNLTCTLGGAPSSGIVITGDFVSNGTSGSYSIIPGQTVGFGYNATCITPGSYTLTLTFSYR